jgi:hypothetical protein
VRPISLLTAILALPVTGIAANAAPGTLAVVVRETAGIRRGNFPTQAQVHLARGALQDISKLRLLSGEDEVPMQASIGSRWPDGSIRQVELNFNTSIAPLGELRYLVEVGGAVLARPVSSERLDLIESSDGLQVGKLRFARQPAALLQSVAFGHEIVGDGLNAFSIVDANGATYLLGGDVAIEIVKPGPLAVQIRYTGAVQLPDDYAVPFVITLEVPNSKSWVKYEARIEDPRRRVREVAFNTSFRLGQFPWVWDFGTGNGSYGAFRNANDSAVLTQVIGSLQPSGWQISTGPQGSERLYEQATADRPAQATGWGHLQGAARAVAFAFEEFGRRPGKYSIALDGNGQVVFRFTPEHPVTAHSISVYEHYVASPAALGAATSPVAMSSPLVVTLEP